MDNNSKRAKEIIEKILYITIASVSKSGEAWNTPVFSAFDEDYNFYWDSDKNAQHSKNIKENPNVFLVIYDSTVPAGQGKGVYIKAKAYELEDQKEIEEAFKYLNKRASNLPPENPTHFTGHYPRRVYKATPEKFWVNSDGEVDGNYVDIREEVNFN